MGNKFGFHSGTLKCKKIDFTNATVGPETSGSIFSVGSSWLNHRAAGSCGFKLMCSNSSTSGDFATMRLRAGSLVAGSATVCVNASASARANSHGNLYGVQGYAQPNGYTSTGNKYVCGLYACIDRTAGGTSDGYDWSAWIDTHIAVKSSGSSYLLRLSHNGTIANDGCITVYNGGRMPVLFNFEDAAGFLTETGDAGSTKAGYLAVSTPVGTKYIQLVTA